MHISQHCQIDRELMKSLNDLVDKYNQYLEKTQAKDQLDINKDLQNIINKLEKVLPNQ